MVGIVAIIFGLLRLGLIARFFSESIMTGFIFGLAIVIVMKQLPKIFGIEAIDGSFWQRLIDLVQNLSETHILTLFVGISSLLNIAAGRAVPRARPSRFGCPLLRDPDLRDLRIGCQWGPCCW